MMRPVLPVCPNKITDLEVKELAIRFTEALIKSWDFKVSVNTKQIAEWGLTIALHLQDKYNQRLNDEPGT